MTKDNFRQFCKTKQKKSLKHYKYILSKLLVQKLEAIIRKENKKNILSFIPLQNEPSILQFMNKTRKNYNYQVPFMEDISFKTVRYSMPLRRKKYNIYEPLNSFKKLKRVDIAIVPVIGIDADSRRVGFGKGMYDRYFGLLKTKPLVIFVQLIECQSKERICDYYDLQADIIITPKNIKDNRRHYASNNNSRCECSRCRNSRIFDS